MVIVSLSSESGMWFSLRITRHLESSAFVNHFLVVELSIAPESCSFEAWWILIELGSSFSRNCNIEDLSTSFRNFPIFSGISILQTVLCTSHADTDWRQLAKKLHKQSAMLPSALCKYSWSQIKCMTKREQDKYFVLKIHGKLTEVISRSEKIFQRNQYQRSHP